jgi:hypothetical protein
MSIVHRDETNKRQARCCGLNKLGCGKKLAPREGRAVDGLGRYRSYQCPECSEKQALYESQRAERDKLLRTIQDWLVTKGLSSGDRDRIDDELWHWAYAAGPDGLAVVRQLLEDLPKLAEVDYFTVSDQARRTAIPLMMDVHPRHQEWFSLQKMRLPAADRQSP